jgi:hypothetical protein
MHGILTLEVCSVLTYASGRWCPLVSHGLKIQKDTLKTRPFKTVYSVMYWFMQRNMHVTAHSFACLQERGAWVAQCYSAELRAGWKGVRVPARAENFSLHHRVQTGSEAHPACYPMGTRGSFPGGKAAGAWSWPLTPSSAEVKECVDFPNTPSWHGAQLKAQGQFYLTFTYLQ